MKKLFKNKKGFTLMEMLIVVAIIVILVAISIPIFSGKLDDAKDAADDANLRAAKSVAVAEYLDEESTLTFTNPYYYDIESGTLVGTAPEAYGKVEGHNVIKVTWGTDGKVDADWE